MEPEITIKLPERQAVALAQLCKRLVYEEIMRHAVNEAEGYVMIDACNAVREIVGVR